MDNTNDGHAVMLRNVKEGDYVKRKLDSNKVYIRNHYDRATKSYCLSDAEDIGRCIFIKADKIVFAYFTY